MRQRRGERRHQRAFVQLPLQQRQARQDEALAIDRGVEPDVGVVKLSVGAGRRAGLIRAATWGRPSLHRRMSAGLIAIDPNVAARTGS